MHPNTFSIKLSEAFMLSPNVKHFIFQTGDFNYMPGQFITIHFEHEGKSLKRSYSVANVPAGKQFIEFAAGYVENGPGTKYLFGLQPGDEIKISGPFGRLILKDEIPGRYILIATSTGITPYRAMLSELQKRLDDHPHLQVLIMLGVQNMSEALYATDFNEFAARNQGRVNFRLQLSRAKGETLQHGQFHGYVQHAFPDINLNPDEDMVYLCGNPGMIDSAFEDLKSRGFQLPRIVREKYISAK